MVLEASIEPTEASMAYHAGMYIPVHHPTYPVLMIHDVYTSDALGPLVDQHLLYLDDRLIQHRIE